MVSHRRFGEQNGTNWDGSARLGAESSEKAPKCVLRSFAGLCGGGVMCNLYSHPSNVQAIDDLVGTLPSATRGAHTELSMMLVSLFSTPSIVRTSRNTRSKSLRLGAWISAIRSHVPFVVCSE